MQLADSRRRALRAGGPGELRPGRRRSRSPTYTPFRSRVPRPSRRSQKLVGDEILDLKYYWCDHYEIEGSRS